MAHWSLDVAADSQEELQDWVKKIREVAQTADARVRTVTAWKCSGACEGSMWACQAAKASNSSGEGSILLVADVDWP